MEKLSERWMFYCGLLAAMGESVDDLKHIQDLIDAEEQGLLLRLPCKVGDTVYSVEVFEIKEFIATQFEVSKIGILAYQGHIYIGQMGNSVFATKEEAEQKLAEMKGKNNGKKFR